YHDNFISHGHLAVDFFFCLSGFVIAYAYDSRLESIGAWQFIKLRLIRLHPLVVVGSALGLLLFILDPYSTLHTLFSPLKKLLLFICSVFMIPYPAVAERYNNFFHLNPPTWSLFWEYIANIFYALFFFRLRSKLIGVLVFFAALLLWYEAYSSGNLSVGWGAGNFGGGGVRVLYSFLAGMLLYRMKWIIRSNVGFTVLAVLLVLAFIIPYDLATNKWIEPLVVIFYFPLLVALGAGTTSAPFLQKLCGGLGEVSYPLYMVHYPFMWLFFSYIQKYKPGMEALIPIILTGIVAMITLAFLVLKYVDQPIRYWLLKRNPVHKIGPKAR
ncbi:acyltransferase, partial [Flavihumibacter sp. CACIAM 22H1]|uniref:acyltransferase family protein n=1 Tax=Flavihumibacter sp. CACIAM 22H1 TaxID=1812911 RepID=UPI0007A87A76